MHNIEEEVCGMASRAGEERMTCERKGMVPSIMTGGKDADKCVNLGIRVETVPDDGFELPYEVKEGGSPSDRGRKRGQPGVW